MHISHMWQKKSSDPYLTKPPFALHPETDCPQMRFAEYIIPPLRNWLAVPVNCSSNRHGNDVATQQRVAAKTLFQQQFTSA